VIQPADLLFTPIRELAAQIRSRQLSPVKLAEVSLERLETFGPRLNAVVTLAGKQALDQAGAAEREIARGHHRGPLHGIPYGAKDLLATKSMPTTWGAAPFRNQRFDYDATVIRKLSDAGAILVAKLSMVELAGGMGYRNADASFTGPGINPWNPNYWSGGSSSGPGSAVGAGLVSFAIGSETVGSILTPSSFCGITGLRPTYGRVSRHGAMALCWSLDKLGPMARSADDCATVLAAIEGADADDPTTIQRLPRRPAPAKSRWRIAVPRGAIDFVQPEVARNFNQAIEVFLTIGDVAFNVVLPDFPYGPAASTIVDAEGASAFSDLIESGGLRELRAETDRIGGYGGAMVRAVDYLQAQRIREKMRKPFHELFQRYDIIVAPSRNTVALPLGIDFNQAYPELDKDRPPNFVSPVGAMIQVGNLLGLPALAIPNGFGRENLPTGLQLVSAPLQESTLIALGTEYQKRTEFHRRRPPGY
jgi:aspartyl-tRNA(Asn)/glutamyl-tRNA(Gln) amidotransferase subunit A